jgi:HEAT repeat protein
MKLKLLIAIAAILGLLVIWQSMGTAPVQLDEIDASIEKLRANDDVEALDVAVKSKNIRTARRAVEAMGYLGPMYVKRLRTALSDPRPQIRQQAATAYARAANIKDIAPLTKVAQTDKSPVVRASAITALGKKRVYEEMETLLQAMNDDDIMVRRRATEAVVLLIGRRYPYKPNASSARRLKYIAVIREFWTHAKGPAGNYYDRERIRLQEAAQ